MADNTTASMNKIKKPAMALFHGLMVENILVIEIKVNNMGMVGMYRLMAK